MDIIVCVKRVPDTSQSDVAIARDGRSIETGNLVFDINEWDRYAVEEAVLLKEKLGGSVTVVSLGPADTEDTLRRCLATGADAAIRLTDQAFTGSDAATIARILYQVIKGLKFDLVLTGAQASDDGYGQVGPALAGLLSLPHASLVTHLEIANGKARVNRELEGGLQEVLEVPLPAILTIQTGINDPRYVSIMGVRKAAKREIGALTLNGLGLKEAEVGESGSATRLARLFPPPVTKQAEVLQGTPEEVVTKLTQVLKEKGGLA